mgnify:CR=1 FL=1
MDKHLSYWQNEIDLEHFSNQHNRADRTGRMAEIFSVFGDNKIESILDCGAGTGVMHDICIEAGVDYQGMEITPKFVEYAEKNKIPMILGDIDNIPYENNTFDACLAFDVLNHLYDYRPAISEMIRVAKKAVIITFFKPSTERLYYVSPEMREITIGWYPGPWDTSNLPATCPRLGWYPRGINHNPVIALHKKYKVLKSPLGIYYSYHTDENDEATCIHHYFGASKILDFISTLSKINNDVYVTEYLGRPHTLACYNSWTKEDTTPPLHCYADTFIIKKTGVRHG